MNEWREEGSRGVETQVVFSRSGKKTAPVGATNQRGVIKGNLMPDFAPYGSTQRAGTKPNQDGHPTAEPNRKGIYLHSGQLYASDEPCSITTILGSCVAVCIWDDVRGFGGATHYLLPHKVSSGAGSVRFGHFAIEQLISRLLAMGGRRRNLNAKIFGGSCIFAGFKKLENQLGTKNVEVALRLLEHEEIPIVTYDVGGPQGRKLIFNTDSGDAWIKLL